MRWTDLLESPTDREPFHNGDSVTFFAGGARCRVKHEDGVLYMSKVFTSEETRGRGDATRAVEKALAYADQQGKTVTLVAMPYNKGDLIRLIAFYERFGFVSQPGDTQMMVRHALNT